MQKRVTGVLLVEDSLHERLVRMYLGRCGVGPREIRLSKSPSGRGSAEGWVRKQFPIEVRVCRTRHAQTRLIVVIDADILTVQRRMRQLDEALRDAGVPMITDADGVLRLVPKRNIETWILGLNGLAVTEEDDYKNARNDWVKLILPAVELLYGWTRPNVEVPASCIPSLQTGIAELRRLSV
jgi:hypothetical protein